MSEKWDAIVMIFLVMAIVLVGCPGKDGRTFLDAVEQRLAGPPRSSP